MIHAMVRRWRRHRFHDKFSLDIGRLVLIDGHPMIVTAIHATESCRNLSELTVTFVKARIEIEREFRCLGKR